ncbi:hypothetical protein H8356DRAFT_1407935 [Neocallimastix lanati (nom. inval.)]|nr:hypothetical protein H8356DRAFT_1407935 [Neocallimastix sp. JGI-2020a]
MSEKYYNIYFSKQRKFKCLVKRVQKAIITKEYKKQGYSLNNYVKKNWNISQAQAYRYLISAKVLDQLEEFEIQPCYERLCRSLYNCTKTTEQIKLLWRTILKNMGSNPECINTSYEINSENCEKEADINNTNNMKPPCFSTVPFGENKTVNINNKNININNAVQYNTPSLTSVSSSSYNENNNQFNNHLLTIINNEPINNKTNNNFQYNYVFPLDNNNSSISKSNNSQLGKNQLSPINYESLNKNNIRFSMPVPSVSSNNNGPLISRNNNQFDNQNITTATTSSILYYIAPQYINQYQQSSIYYTQPPQTILYYKS